MGLEQEKAPESAAMTGRPTAPNKDKGDYIHVRHGDTAGRERTYEESEMCNLMAKEAETIATLLTPTEEGTKKVVPETLVQCTMPAGGKEDTVQIPADRAKLKPTLAEGQCDSRLHKEEEQCDKMPNKVEELLCDEEPEEDFQDLEGAHRFNIHKYRSEALLTMKTWIFKPRSQGKEEPRYRVEVLADSGSSVSIISYNLAVKVDMQIRKKGSASLQDASGNDMDVSGRDSLMVKEEDGISHKIKVIVSKDLGEEEVAVGLEDLKALSILHKEFPRTMPGKRTQIICKVRATSDALAAYYQIDMDNRDQHKTTFILSQGRYFFRKTVMGIRLSLDSWPRASD